MRVIHVVDRVSGGVPTAVSSYIKNSPTGIDHHVLAPFEQGLPSAIWTDLPVTHHDLGIGTLRRVHRVRSLSVVLNADVVHAHSSFSGVYARSLPMARSARIVYTPHCFAFERRDISWFARLAFRAIEWLLGARTDWLAACSPGEASRAMSFRTLRGKVGYVPNVAAVSARVATMLEKSGRRFRLGMVGRLTAQKDPVYFANLVRTLQDAGVPVDGVWIGGGDWLEGDLTSIEVTGWLSGESLVRALSSLDLYVHTAAWEGFPISILDAFACGLPILVRSIDAFGDLDSSQTIERGIDDYVRSLSSEVGHQMWIAGNRRAWSKSLAENSAREQRSALATAWGVTG